MNFIAITAWKDVRRALRDPIALVIWIAMPFMLTGLLALAFGSRDPAPQGKLLVDDQDKSILSGFVSSAFSREPLSKMVTVEAVEYEAGRKRLDAGDVSALLVIPKGFSTSFLRREPVALTLWTNPSQRILPGIIKESIAILLEGGFYIQSVIGDDLAKFTEGTPSELQVAGFGIEVMRLSRQFSKALNPPLIELEMNVVVKKEAPQVSFPVLFFPGMLMLAIFGLATSMSEDIWRERALGTLRRSLTTSHSVAAFLAGKTISVATVFAGLATVGILAGRFVLGAAIVNVPLSIVWIVLCGAGLFLMAALIQVFSTEQRAGVLLNGFVLFLMSMIGGTFFPFEAMPKWLAAIGQYTPNGYAVLRFKEVNSGALDASSLLLHFGILCAFVVTTFALFARRVSRWILC
jgi:ABC-2 type transport system permease protein